MSGTDYVGGAGFFLVTAGAAIAAAARATQGRGWRGSERILALFVAAVGVLMAAELIPLALGVLTRATPAITALAALLIVWRLPRPQPAAASSAQPVQRSGALSWVLAAAACLAAAVFGLAYVKARAFTAFTHIDMVSFHLPTVARWIQSGSVWRAEQLLPYQAQGYYPDNGELMMLSAVLPWHNDFAVRYLGAIYMSMTGIAAYALSRELRAPAAASALFAAIPVTLPIVALAAYDEGLPDPLMYATFLAGLVFLARHWRTRRTADLVVAGLALGICFGTKWYAVSSVTVILAAWLIGALAARLPARQIGRDFGALAGLVACGGGFWLVRNLVAAGNPVFPVKVAVFGTKIFSAPHDVYRELAGFSIFGYLGNSGIWRQYFFPATLAYLIGAIMGGGGGELNLANPDNTIDVVVLT